MAVPKVTLTITNSSDPMLLISQTMVYWAVNGAAASMVGGVLS